MASENCYYLLSADAECIERRLKLKNVDVTSIVNALENKVDPAKIFHNADRVDLVQHTVSYFLDSIDSIKQWLDQILFPTMQVMEKRDLRVCLKNLGMVQAKIDNMMLTMKGTKKKDPKRKWNDSQRCYTCECKECNEAITVSNYGFNALDLLEGHAHIGAYIAENIVHEKQTDPVCKITKQKKVEKSITIEVKEGPIIIKQTKEAEINTRNRKGEEITTSSSSSSEKEFSSNRSSNKIDSSSSESSLSNLDISVTEINKVLYPSKLIDHMKATQSEYHFNYCTLQYCAENLYRCLLCDAILQELSILQHLLGHRHKLNLRSSNALKKVKIYHEIIARLPEHYQTHQVVLVPDKKMHFVKCHICSDSVREPLIWTHLCSRKHKNRMLCGKFNKYHFFDKMLHDITTLEEDEDTSEVSIQSLVIQNSSNVLQSMDTSKLKIVSVPSNDNNVIPETILNNSTQLSNSNALISALTKNKSNNGQKENKMENKSNEIPPVEGTSKSVPNNNNLETKSPPRHVIIPSFKATPQDFLDVLENRFQAHRQFLLLKEDKLSCTACSMDIPLTPVEIRNHLIGQDHEKFVKKVPGDWKYRFFCDLCFKVSRKEHKWTEHLMSSEHKQRSDTITKTKPHITPFVEYECTTCRLIIFGNQTSIRFHQNETVPRKFMPKVKETKLPVQLDNLMKNNAIFYEKVFKLLKESDEVLSSIQLSWKCCEAIEKALRPVFGDCKAYPFGSRVSGLGNLGSDLDVFVDVGYMFDGLFYQDCNSQSQYVTEAAKTLRKHSDFTDIVPIPQARTPIAQVYHKATRLDCDLSFRHGLSVKNTEFLRLCIEVQPILKSLILFLKHWSHTTNMNIRITTYALSMLSIFFMQTQGYLPSLKKIRELDPTEPQTIGGWRTYSYIHPIEDLKKHVKIYEPLTKDLVREFMQYYSQFKYDTDVVCPLLGHTVLKTDFSEEDGSRLPPEMNDYVARINQNKDNERFRSVASMCVQDPFDLSHNLTKACPIDAVNKFATLCKLSLVSLSKK